MPVTRSKANPSEGEGPSSRTRSTRSKANASEGEGPSSHTRSTRSGVAGRPAPKPKPKKSRMAKTSRPLPEPPEVTVTHSPSDPPNFQDDDTPFLPEEAPSSNEMTDSAVETGVAEALDTILNHAELPTDAQDLLVLTAQVKTLVSDPLPVQWTRAIDAVLRAPDEGSVEESIANMMSVLPDVLALYPSVSYPVPGGDTDDEKEDNGNKCEDEVENQEENQEGVEGTGGKEEDKYQETGRVDENKGNEEEREEQDPPLRSSKRRYGPKRPRSSVKRKDKRKGVHSHRKQHEDKGSAGKNDDDEDMDDNVNANADANDNANANDQDEDDNDSGSELDPDESINYKKGPLEAEYRARAIANYEEYEAKQRELAREAGKPVQAIFRAAGDSRKLLRDVNLWNLFQVWMVHPEGGKVEESDTRLEDETGSDGASRKSANKIEWWEPLYDAQLLPIRQKGLSKRRIQKIGDEFANNARHANRNIGVIVFGFVIDVHGKNSVMWGAGQEFVNMRNRSQSQLNQYLRDVETLLRQSNLNIRLGIDKSSDHWYMANEANQIARFTGKDKHRQFVSLALRYDLSRVVPSSSWKNGKFKWQDFANIAYLHQVKIVNWHSGVPVPGNGLQTLKTNVPVNKLYELSEERLKELKQHYSAYERGEREEDFVIKLNDKALRLVSWTEAEKALSVEEQGEVGVVLATDDTTLCKVLNSDKWVQTVSGDMKDKGKGKGKVVLPPITPPKAVIAQPLDSVTVVTRLLGPVVLSVVAQPLAGALVSVAFLLGPVPPSISPAIVGIPCLQILVLSRLYPTRPDRKDKVVEKYGKAPVASSSRRQITPVRRTQNTHKRQRSEDRNDIQDINKLVEEDRERKRTKKADRPRGEGRGQSSVQEKNLKVRAKK
ncbi:hypothetical protein K435DRAFT_866938 [Dendrothele bispora CBS 962.96]|uniref:Uncharacterized protein n=1 Tax=Dendrothele bispora (strain CBS 962.96) TaxID=1314807 RepID=A0A4S8LGX3_DENBC|nr:hypothetical protein K435DRAFT_866938 [Dendrothele bispora CBS 962.96]